MWCFIRRYLKYDYDNCKWSYHRSYLGNPSTIAAIVYELSIKLDNKVGVKTPAMFL